MAIQIIGTGKSVPQQKVHNNDLDKSLETSDEWIRTHTGIESRHIAAAGEKPSTFGSAACAQALLSAAGKGKKVAIEEVGLIICGTATGDFGGFPSSACVIQKNLGASNAAAFDVSAACSGFIYGLECAAGIMERRNIRYALVTGAEVLSKVADWSDRSTCVLFGDGAGAVLLEKTAESVSNGASGIYTTLLGADGSGAMDLYLDESRLIRMNGRAVYTFAVEKLTCMVEELLQKENLSIDEVDYIVCHQANERIIQAAAKRLKYDESKFVYNIKDYGNTSAASIPITLADMESRGDLKKGMKLLLAGFGGGLTWGGAFVIW